MRNSILGVLLTAALAAPALAQGTAIQAQGATDLTPLLSKGAAAYEAARPGTQIAVKGTSSGAGVASLKSSEIDIAGSDVAVSDASFVDTTLGVVGFAFVANADAGVKNLDRRQLIDIFAGKIKNWKDVGGKDVPITIISRDIGTGTRLVLEQKVAKTLIPTKVVGNADEVIKAVQTTSGALGYVATYFVGKNTDMVVTYDGMDPTIANIRNHSYAFSTDEHLYVRSDAKAEARAFVNWIAENKDLLNSNGIY